MDYDAAVAALEWCVELGISEAHLDAPVDAYALPDRLAAPQMRAAPADAQQPPGGAQPPQQGRSGADHAPAVPAPPARGPDPAGLAQTRAGAAQSLEALREAMSQFEHCDLKKGARSTVFADGNPKARVMVIGEAPGRDEDRAGRPFVGRSGQMLDRMLAAIGLERASPDPAAAAYLANVLPWRPPGDREPEAAEIAVMLPFLTRHVELVDPDVVILMGNTACSAGLGKRGIMRLRGAWAEAFGRPAMPMTHPAFLLRQPDAKRDAWADLLQIRARLDGDQNG